MPFSANITQSRINGNFFMLTADALNRLRTGRVTVFLHPETDKTVTGRVSRLPDQNQGTVRCPDLFNGGETSLLPLPLQLGDVLEYEINDGKIRLMANLRGENSDEEPMVTSRPKPAATPSASSPLPPNQTEPPQVGNDATDQDVLTALVRWIHEEPFQRHRRSNRQLNPVDGAPEGIGWGFRIKEYAYAKKLYSCFSQVYSETAAHIAALQEVVGAHGDWTAVTERDQLSESELGTLEQEAEWICKQWGGVHQNAGYADTWRVVRSAVTGVDDVDAPMSSGWTKVASFATDGRDNGQTIWDSRMATSVIWRIDQILHASGLPLDTVDELVLGTIPARNSGTRPRELHLSWPKGYGKWKYHFGGGEVVRRIVGILNDPSNGFPRMPRPDGSTSDWDVFGVGLVLFMDGY